MNKMIKMQKSRLWNIVIIVSLLVLILIYFLLQSRVSGIVPFIRKMKLLTFLSSIKKTNSISVQEFWQFREFYYPGEITINRKGVPDKRTPKLNPKLTPLLFLQFNSQYILSNEYLINAHDLHLVIPQNKGYIFNSDRSLGYKENSSSVDLIFIKPISEMTKANGFLYINDQDKTLVKGKYWLVITKIVK